MDVTGSDYPPTYKNNSIQPLEGKSLLPVLKGKVLKRKSWFMEHEGNRAVRKGEWKLVSTVNGEWELYDMNKDRTETLNVMDRYPEIGQKLKEMWNEWALRVQVYPRN